MRLTMTSHSDQVTRLQCDGEVTQFDIPSDRDLFQDTLGPVIYRRRVLLNMENAQYVDSSGIGWLLAAHKRFERDGGRLVLHSVPPAVDQVLRLLKLNTLLHIAADEREAERQAAEANAS
jgi:anti-anti-sigma factor